MLKLFFIHLNDLNIQCILQQKCNTYVHPSILSVYIMHSFFTFSLYYKLCGENFPIVFIISNSHIVTPNTWVYLSLYANNLNFYCATNAYTYNHRGKVFTVIFYVKKSTTVCNVHIVYIRCNRKYFNIWIQFWHK